MKTKNGSLQIRLQGVIGSLSLVICQAVAQPGVANQPGSTGQSGSVVSQPTTKTPHHAKTITDQLLAALLEKHLPTPVYERGNNPWPGGAYKLEVFKIGRPEVISSTANIQVKMPLKILITGNVSNDLLQVTLNCSTSFTTVGEIFFTPTQPGTINTLASSVTLPIPPVMADCNGMQVPIDEYLKTVVAQNKRQWELKLDTEVKGWLAK